MTKTVIRHHGTSRSAVPHPVTSHQCRTTLDPAKVTCPTCIEAPPPNVVRGEVLAQVADRQATRARVAPGLLAIRQPDGSLVSDPEWHCVADVMRSAHGRGITAIDGELVRLDQEGTDD